MDSRSRSNHNLVVIVVGAEWLVDGAVEVAPPLVRVDIPIMTAVALICVPVFISGRRVSRIEGGLFVGAYAVYLAYLLSART